MSTKTSRQVNIGVVGLGYMGITHLRAYRKIRQARVVAVCDPQRAPENGVLHGVAGNIKSNNSSIDLGRHIKAYRALDELLADPEVEIVDICTPTPQHPEQVIAALQAGKHVLCEKPLARTAADTRRVLRVAKTAKGFLMPAMCMRFWTGWHELKQFIQDKKYGAVLTASFRRISQMPAWSAAKIYAKDDAGGALYDLHIHDTDFINFLFGKPRRVSSGGVIAENGTINHIVTQYEFPNGPSVTAEGSWLHQGSFDMAFNINFERATLEYSFAKGDFWQLFESGGKPSIQQWRGSDGYDAETRYFVDCVANNRRPQIMTAEDALTTIQICEAEEKSVRRNKPVGIR